ncbi:HEL193Cp [Eremothecium sinecaudum]|uniref:HEL193Cp n=1 Tax=Eremothecium sinecaudum TaxID=45286 RepID=A0A109UZA7_9SACH|nr:HEL193Cp [Eremothecium sinecaudum]AMD21088.1 HEL193Cp [Eremothecium sinecaudum]
MVLPLIVATGITIVALTTKSGIKAWNAYKKLTPAMIARLNNLQYNRHIDPTYPYKYRSKLPKDIQHSLEQYYGGFNKRMTEAEALQILHISASEVKHLNMAMLKRKHRTCMIKNHPDKDGSPYLAMKVNEARDILEKSSLLRNY